MSEQRTRKFVTKILRKTCSSLVKIISDGENDFTQNKYNKWQQISAKNEWYFCKKIVQKCKYGIIYTVQLEWCRPDRYSNSKFIIKTFYII